MNTNCEETCLSCAQLWIPKVLIWSQNKGVYSRFQNITLLYQLIAYNLIESDRFYPFTFVSLTNSSSDLHKPRLALSFSLYLSICVFGVFRVSLSPVECEAVHRGAAWLSDSSLHLLVSLCDTPPAIAPLRVRLVSPHFKAGAVN